MNFEGCNVSVIYLRKLEERKKRGKISVGTVSGERQSLTKTRNNQTERLSSRGFG